ncbi:Uncharacterized protein SCF082_LOCUS40615 [Durusdinium trenchii]|uniref:Uncharacterized protein n=1 Tax=Durusdinium trenchii TaxID=1381693 RepID=A0ABP0QBZ6_9DINO
MSIEEENGGSESESDAQELNRAKRRLRTEKARAAALLARQVKRAEAEKAKLTTSDHPAARFKPDLQPNPEINKPGNFSNTIHRRRIRVVYSWFKAWCTSLLSILQSCTNRNSSFCYTVNVVDDTSIRLADLISGEASTLHLMLPRVLELLSRKEQTTNEQAKAIELLMDSVGIHARREEEDDENDGLGQLGESDWVNFLEDIQESKDLSFAEINAKRKQLTFKAFSDPTMPTKITILESVILPNVAQMDTLFKRSGMISSLYHLPKNAAQERSDLMQRSSEVFLTCVSGQMGEEMVAAYVKLLVEFPVLGEPQFAESYFELVLQSAGDAWRRFSLEQDRFPNKMFKLANLDHQSFLEKYRAYQYIERCCCECVDLEFSSILLAYITEQDDDLQVQEKVTQIQAFLRSLCIYAPVSADVVECLHGACQSRLARFRGPRQSDDIAKEITVLDKLCSSYGKFQEWMWNRLGDRRALNRLRAYGNHRGNQHSQQGRSIPQTFGLNFDDLDKLLSSGKSPAAPRKLCGWNIFQRETMAHSQLQPDEWKAALKNAAEIGRECQTKRRMPTMPLQQRRKVSDKRPCCNHTKQNHILQTMLFLWARQALMQQPILVGML